MTLLTSYKVDTTCIQTQLGVFVCGALVKYTSILPDPATPDLDQLRLRISMRDPKTKSDVPLVARHQDLTLYEVQPEVDHKDHERLVPPGTVLLSVDKEDAEALALNNKSSRLREESHVMFMCPWLEVPDVRKRDASHEYILRVELLCPFWRYCVEDKNITRFKLLASDETKIKFCWRW